MPPTTIPPLRDRDSLEHSSRAAILSLVFGILGSCTAGVASVAGLVLGLAALRQTKRNDAREQRAVAIVGITLSSLTFIGGIGSLFVLVPMLTGARTAARHDYERQSLQNVGRAIRLYALDNAGRLPPTADWASAIDRYFKGTLRVQPNGAVALGVDGRFYAINAGLEGKRINEIDAPERTVLLFECDQGASMCGGRELVPQEPKDAEGFMILFFDRHVERVPGDRVEELIWDP